MAASPTLRECELAAPVMEWFRGRGFTAYGEVPWHYRAIDIVGLMESSAETVEMKLSLTKQVIYQSNLTLAAADRAWCAIASVPRKLESRGWLDNLGVLRVVSGRVDVIREAPYPFRRPGWQSSLRAACENLEPWGEAGMPTMRGVGPAQAVYNQVQRYREQNPGASWDRIYQDVPNHYSHARSMQGAMRVVAEVRAALARRDARAFDGR